MTPLGNPQYASDDFTQQKIDLCCACTDVVNITGLVIQQHTVHVQQQAHLSAAEKQFNKGGVMTYTFSLNKICKSLFFHWRCYIVSVYSCFQTYTKILILFFVLIYLIFLKLFLEDVIYSIWRQIFIFGGISTSNNRPHKEGASFSHLTKHFCCSLAFLLHDNSVPALLKWVAN